MASAPFITKQIMQKAWNLKNAGVAPAMIAATLDISLNSTQRIIACVKAVLAGVDEEQLYKEFPSNQVKNAVELFGTTEKKDDAPREEDTERVREYAGEVLDILREMASLIAKQNELLGKFCTEFGVK